MPNYWPDCGILSCPSKAQADTSSPRTGRTQAGSKSTAGRRNRSKAHASSQPSKPAYRRGSNKGVGHGIKKPKLKAKEKKASNPAKMSVRRLKQVKPPPRLAEHRSPAIAVLTAKKRHRLSSPGMSLLENPDAVNDVDASPTEGGKFFKSRARAAATVQITSNVMLSASYGDITLKQRAGSSGFKKNIGGASTENVKQSPLKASNKINEKFNVRDLAALSNKAASNRPKPTRFPSTPSPNKKRPLPQVRAKALYQDKENNQQAFGNCGVRSSPRRKSLLSSSSSNCSLLLPPAVPETVATTKLTKSSLTDSVESPNKRKRSPTRESITSSSSPAVRSSPRRFPSISTNTVASPLSTPNKSTPSKRSTPSKTNGNTTITTINCTPSKGGNSIVSPRTIILKKATPIKTVSGVTRFSPRKANFSSQASIAQRNVVIEMVHQSPDAKSSSNTTPVKKAILLNLSNSPASNASPSRRIMMRNSPLRRNSPSHLQLTPSKSSSTNSPRHADLPSSPDSQATNQDSAESDAGFKYFPIFDPEKRKSHCRTDKLKKASSRSGVCASLGDSGQLMLDAGQKEFGAQSCRECGLLYDAGDPDDDKLHEQHHNRVMTALAYTNWKKERQISTVDSRGGRCILISSSDPQYCWRKVCDVLAVVDEELGFSEQRGVARGAMWVVLYVVDNSVAGCLVAEKVEAAHRVVSSSSLDEINTDDGDSPDSELLCCSTQFVPIKYGISRIWVRSDNRRKGLASRLVDSFRGNVVAYHYLKMDEFAFSDPTPNGVRFARSYTKKTDFLVYRHGL